MRGGRRGAWKEGEGEVYGKREITEGKTRKVNIWERVRVSLRKKEDRGKNSLPF